MSVRICRDCGRKYQYDKGKNGETPVRCRPCHLLRRIFTPVDAPRPRVKR